MHTHNTTIANEIRAFEDQFLDWFADQAERNSISHMDNIFGSFFSYMEEFPKDFFLDPYPFLELKQMAVQYLAQDKNSPQSTKVFFDFIKRLRDFHELCFLEELGVDSFTKLKDFKQIEFGVVRELKRLERKGADFTIALLAIDDFDFISARIEDSRMKEIIFEIANKIRDSIRSYDDAGRISRHEFVLLLKQSSGVGGLSALERFKTELNDISLSCEVGGETRAITVSGCVYAPTEKDNLDNMLKDLRQGIREKRSSKGASFEYVEIAPIQKFVKESTS